MNVNEELFLGPRRVVAQILLIVVAVAGIVGCGSDLREADEDALDYAGDDTSANGTDAADHRDTADAPDAYRADNSDNGSDTETADGGQTNDAGCSPSDTCPDGRMCEAGRCVAENEYFRFLEPQDGERLTPTITFRVETNLDEVHKIEYYADDWPLGTSADRNSDWELTYEFQNPGENRVVEAHGFDSSGTQIAGAEISITVTDESGRLPGECTAGNSSSSNDAQCLLAHDQAGHIHLLRSQVSGVQDDADAYDNIVDSAAGGPVKTSCYGNAPCTTTYLDLSMLAVMVDLIQDDGYSFRVTSIAGGSHSPNSYHYVGQAFDVDKVDGIKIDGDSQTARDFMSACRNSGATNVLGPSNHVGHNTHIHCRW